jgi:8-oxo-dGTP pyrophosphatase MutT (NUDIX family)
MTVATPETHPSHGDGQTPDNRERIKVKARVLVRRGEEVLLEQRLDALGTPFFRPLGGNIEFGEAGIVAAAREFQEETGFHLEAARYLTALEDLGDGPSGPWHEVTLLFEASVAEAAFYVQDTVAVRETGGRSFTAHWVAVADLPGLGGRLRPPGLLHWLPGAGTLRETRPTGGAL